MLLSKLVKRLGSYVPKLIRVNISGNIVSWKTARLETHNMEISEHRVADLCEPQKPFYAVIATWQPMWEMKKNCDKLNGELPKWDNSPGLMKELEGLTHKHGRLQNGNPFSINTSATSA